MSLLPCPGWGAKRRTCHWVVTVGWLRAAQSWTPSPGVQGWPSRGSVSEYTALGPHHFTSRNVTSDLKFSHLWSSWTYFHPANAFQGVDGEEEGLGMAKHRDETENCSSGTFVNLGHSSYFFILVFFVPQHCDGHATWWPWTFFAELRAPWRVRADQGGPC